VATCGVNETANARVASRILDGARAARQAACAPWTHRNAADSCTSELSWPSECTSFTPAREWVATVVVGVFGGLVYPRARVGRDALMHSPHSL